MTKYDALFDLNLLEKTEEQDKRKAFLRDDLYGLVDPEAFDRSRGMEQIRNRRILSPPGVVEVEA